MRHLLFRLICGVALCGALVAQSSKGSEELVVYAYDSFVADWGPGPELARRFERLTGCRVRLVSCGDAGQVLSRAILERGKPVADVLVGIDNNLVARARREGILEPYKPAGADAIVPAELRLADDWLLTPYDWGYFAIIHDAKSGVRAPRSLEDLASPEFAKKLVMMDPRTSTPGAGFLAWTIAVYGDRYLDYWKRLRPNILTLAPGWDAGYALFTAGEAPLVISYTTSPAYHLETEKTDRYRALIFPEGHVAQIEGVGIAKGSRHRDLARRFVDFMLTEEAQSILPLTQWMYPVNRAVPMPDSYRAAPRAGKSLTLDAERAQAAVDAVIDLLAR